MKIYATATLIGRDKSGVIASVTQFLFQNKANIESLEEQVSRGQFSMTLQASWLKENFDTVKVKKGLEKLAADLKMELKLHIASAKAKQRMALFVTKESHTLEAILAAVQQGKIKATPALVISNRPNLKPLAQKAGLPFLHIPYQDQDRKKAETKMLEVLEREQIDLIILARFMKILSPQFVWRWKNKILNIHPSLLPAFPGAAAYRQAYEKGVKIIGVTSHFVTPDLDQGPIICQEALKVRPGETLASMIIRGQASESKCLVRAIQLVLKKRLDVHWGRVYGV